MMITILLFGTILHIEGMESNIEIYFTNYTLDTYVFNVPKSYLCIYWTQIILRTTIHPTAINWTL